MQIIVDNLATEYADEGNGPVVLLLHGWQSNLHSFDNLTHILSKNWRVVRFDLPGFGNTEMPRSKWDLDNYAQFVSKFIDKLNLKVECIGGHSFGGRVIIKGIASDIIHAKKVILIASAGVDERNQTRALIIKILTKIGSIVMWIPPLIFWRTKIREKLYDYLGSDYLKAGNLRQIYLNTIRENLSPFAEKIKHPTLLVWGEQDTATPIKDGLRLSQLIDGSTIEVVKGASHFVHEDQSEQVFEYINKFLHD